MVSFKEYPACAFHGRHTWEGVCPPTCSFYGNNPPPQFLLEGWTLMAMLMSPDLHIPSATWDMWPDLSPSHYSHRALEFEPETLS